MLERGGRASRSPQTRPEGRIDAGPQPTPSTTPLHSPPHTRRTAASAPGSGEGPSAAACTHPARGRQAASRARTELTGLHADAEHCRASPPSALRASRCPDGAGLRGASDAGAVSRQHSIAERRPMGKRAGPPFESKRPTAPAEAGAWPPGIGWRPAFPRLRTRCGRPQGASGGALRVALRVWGASGSRGARMGSHSSYRNDS